MLKFSELWIILSYFATISLLDYQSIARKSNPPNYHFSEKLYFLNIAGKQRFRGMFIRGKKDSGEWTFGKTKIQGNDHSEDWLSGEWPVTNSQDWPCFRIFRGLQFFNNFIASKFVILANIFHFDIMKSLRHSRY